MIVYEDDDGNLWDVPGAATPEDTAQLARQFVIRGTAVRAWEAVRNPDAGSCESYVRRGPVYNRGRSHWLTWEVEETGA